MERTGTGTLLLGSQGIGDERRRQLGRGEDELALLRAERVAGVGVLELRHGGDVAGSDLGRVLELRKGTVESRLFRARERLKTMLEPYL